MYGENKEEEEEEEDDDDEEDDDEEDDDGEATLSVEFSISSSSDIASSLHACDQVVKTGRGGIEEEEEEDNDDDGECNVKKMVGKRTSSFIFIIVLLSFRSCSAIGSFRRETGSMMGARLVFVS